MQVLFTILGLFAVFKAAGQTIRPELVVENGVTEHPIVAFAPDGKWFVTAALGEISIWDRDSLTQLRSIEYTAGGANRSQISMSSDGHYVIAYDSVFYRLTISDLETGQVKLTPWHRGS